MPDSSLPSNSTATLTVERMGGLGDGLAVHLSQRVLIPKSVPGDVLEVALRNTGAEALHGDILRIITPGADRVDTPCPYFSTCGSCTLQHMSTEAYRAFKHGTLHSALRKAGYADAVGRSDVTFLGSATRRRADFKLTSVAGSVRFGYLRLKSHSIAPVDQCLILSPRLQAYLPVLKSALLEYVNIPVTGIQITDAASGIDVVLRAGENFPGSHLKTLKSLAPALQAARVSLRREEEIVPIYEASAVAVAIGSHSVPLPPGAFLQASEDGQNALTEHVLRGAAGCSQVLDLFSGIGTYSIPLAEKASVHAVEMDDAMVRNLAAFARGRNLSLTAERRDLFRNAINAAALKRYGAVVINPPRAGAKLQVERIAEARVPRVIMVSCNPATFARDAGTLAASGYRLESAHGIDQFVWSSHLEIVALFMR